ncbi:MFS transporter [candidate division CSSED10-310 bacterium]|uniref:MFS transporter n=1 Tax=candidate division CSSED10-310 bacterium TaxID=2855610 RepID=A0ABV6YY77_UNCC1
MLLHNTFGATQDVAIDALAVKVLGEQERGLANGVMFAAAYLGQTIGGSGVLFLTGLTGFKASFFFVGACILSVTLLVALPLREQSEARSGSQAGSRLTQFKIEVSTFGRATYQAFTSTRAAKVGILFALVPAGGMALGLALQSNLAVEIGLSDDSIAWLNMWSAILSALGCVVGGLLSDKFGRRKMLAIYVALMAIPILYLALELKRQGWIMPVDTQAPDRPVAAAELILAFWIAALFYSILQGLMYGTRTALFMDVTVPAVAATQFTAYMALLNLTITYSAVWQGWAIERFGYPTTLIIDACYGLICLTVLPFMKKQDVCQENLEHGFTNT